MQSRKYVILSIVGEKSRKFFEKRGRYGSEILVNKRGVLERKSQSEHHLGDSPHDFNF